ncbi:peptidoglycan/LPS O-acetylase OafA/YrhL [Microbacterium sp. 1154]|uniref:acyltransferase family protein n=1 Tax=Microbacterium sp. 1154 TaxID=2817733 RepID=UPI00285C4126|nr:acyltransferase [Microbacterium sp. 1154]MDR6691205.1 peptidoglycan/LPS O-acetylase OafA/YrhL [Microbacterium sp. 1154]
MPERRARDNTLDFLRLFAALVVVVAHSQTDLRAPFAWGASELVDGVGMFFIISGLLVYKSGESIYRRTGRWRDFFWNRYLRVAPAIYVFAASAPFLLVALGAVALPALANPEMIVWLGASFVLLPNYDPSVWQDFGTGVINGQLWTIPAEVSFYLVVPLLVLLARRFGFWVMLTPMIVLSIVGPLLSAQGGLLQTVVHHTFLEKAAFFTVGIFWARYWGRVPANWWLFGVVLAVYLPVKVFALQTDVVGPIEPLLIAVPLGYLVVQFGYNGPLVLARLTQRLGDLSYGTYIWHVLVINAFIWFGWTDDWWLVLIVVGVTLFVAWLSWHLVEKRALSLKRTTSREGVAAVAQSAADA